MSEFGDFVMDTPKKSTITMDKNQANEFGSFPVIDALETIGRRAVYNASVRNFDVRPYEDFLGKGNVNMNLPIDVLNELRAQNQSGWGLTGKAIGQTATTIAGDMLTGIGAMIGGIEMLTTDLLKEKQEVWDDVFNKGISGFFTKMGTGISDFGRESMPIYQTKRAQEGAAFGDATWWASMFPTVGSAVSSFVPVLGSIKTLGYVGKLAKMANSATKFGQAANKVGRLLTNPTTQKLMGTAMGAHLDSMMEIAHGYDDQFQYALSLGFSEDDARRFAATYASEAYKDAWALNIMTNFLQMNSLFKGVTNAPINNAKLSKSIKEATEGFVRKGSKFQPTTDAIDLTKVELAKHGGKKVLNFLTTMGMEGFEEVRVDYALASGEIAAKDELGIYDYRSSMTPLARAGILAKDNHAWDSFIWGAIGGGVMHTVMGGEDGRGLITKVLNNKKIQEWEQNRTNAIINTLQDVSESIEEIDGDMMPEIIQTPDGKYTGIKDAVVSKLVPIFDSVSKSNGFEYVMKLFDGFNSLSNKEIALAYGKLDGVDDLSTQPDSVLEEIGAKKRASIDALRSEFKIANDIYNRNSQNVWGSKADSWINDKKANLDYLANYYKRWEKAIETKIASYDPARTLLENDHRETLKSINAKRFALEEEKKQINSKIEDTKNLINSTEQALNDEVDKKMLKSLRGRQMNYKKAINKIQSTIDDISLKINTINENIESEATQSRSKKNRKDRDVNKLNIKHLKKERAELAELLKKHTKELNVLQLESQDIQTNIDIRVNDNKLKQTQIENLKRSLQIFEAQSQVVNTKLDEEKTRENNNTQEYNLKLREFGDQIVGNNKTLNDLYYILKEIKSLRLDSETQLTEETIKEDLVPIINEMVDQSEKFKETKEQAEEKEAKVEEQVAQDETAEVTTDTETDDKKIEYAKNENGGISWVKIKGRNYYVGDSFEFVGQDETGLKRDVQKYTITEFYIDHTEVGDLVKVITNKGTHISAFKLNENDSFKRVEKVIKDDLNTSKGRIKSYLRKFIDEDSISDSKEQVETKLKLVENILDSIADALNSNVEVENGVLSIPYNKLGTIKDLLDRLPNIDFDNIIESNPDFTKTLNIFRINISTDINHIYNRTVNDFINQTANLAKKHLPKIKKILDDFKKDNRDIKIIQQIYDYYNHIYKILETRELRYEGAYDIDLYVLDVDTEEKDQLRQEYSDIAKYLNKDIQWDTDIDPEVRNDLIKSGISTIADDILRMTFVLHNDFHLDIIDVKAEEFNIEQDLYNISLFDFDPEEDGEYNEYDKSDWRYHISESHYNGLVSLKKILDQFDIINSFEPNKVYSFNDIMDSIYQLKDGKNQVKENVLGIFNLLSYIHNVRNNFASLIHQMENDGVNENIITTFKDLNDQIRKRTLDPIADKSLTPFLKDYTVLDEVKYLNYFFRNFFQRQWNVITQSGMRRLNAYIYQAIQKVYDSATRTIDDTIEIDGVTVNTEDLYTALEGIKDGQIFRAIYDKTTDSATIKLKVGDQEVTLEKIQLNQHANYEGISLAQESGIYDSIFGTKYGISNYVNHLMTSISKYNTIWNVVKEFYIEYEDAKSIDQHNTTEIQNKLRNILKKISEKHPEFIENLIAAQNHRLSTEEFKADNTTIDTLDLKTVYLLFRPIFYNKRLDNIKDMRRDTHRFRMSYDMFNNTLYNDYNQARLAFEIAKEKGYVDLKLNHINKTGIAYGGAKSKKFNVNDNIKKGENGRVVLVSTQPEPETMTLTVSNMDSGKIIPLADIQGSPVDENNHVQIFAQVKSNNSNTGASYIPLVRGNVSTDGNEFSKILTPYITNKIIEILNNAEVTNYSEKDIANVYKSPDKSRVEKYQKQYSNIMSDISEFIIPRYNNPGEVKDFNVKSLYIGENGRYSKTLTFLGVNRTARGGTLGRSYEYKFDVTYKLENGVFKPTRLSVERTRTKANHLKTGTSKTVFSESDIRNNNLDLSGHITKETHGSKSKIKGDYQVITFDDNITLEKVLSSKMFQNIFGQLQRSVHTYWTGDNVSGGGFVLGYKGKGRHTGKFDVSRVKKFANSIGVKYDESKIPDAYDSLQDFYLNTLALTTSAMGIKNKSGKIISNYMVDGISPAMWFEIDRSNESSEDTLKTIESKNTLETYLESIIQKQTKDSSWFVEAMKNSNGREVLESIGFNTSMATESDIEDIVNLLNDLYTRIPIQLKIEDTGRKNGHDTYGKYSSISKTISLNKSFVSQDVNKSTMASVILHESIHAYLLHTRRGNKTYNNLVYKNIENYIEDIFKDVSSMNVEEFNAKYKCEFESEDFNYFKVHIEHVNKNHSEIVTYMFTDSKFADLSNQVIIQSKIENEPNESLWSKFIKAVLKLIGIKNINTNSLLHAIIAGSVRPTYSPTGSVSNEQIKNTDKTPVDETPIEITTVKEFNPNDDISIDDLFEEDITGTAGRGVGYAHTSREISNSNILKSQEKELYLSHKDFLKLDDHFRDENNQPIC